MAMQAVAQGQPRSLPDPQEHAKGRRGVGWETIGLLVIFSLCLALRIVNLSALPIFIDEADTARSAAIIGGNPGPDTWLVSMAAGVYPLFPWVATPFVRLLPDLLLAVRCASACVGAVGLVAIWGVGRELVDARVGLLAALFYALCPDLLFHNRLAVPDGLVAACGAGSLLFALRLSKTARRRDALMLGLCLALGLLTKVFAFSMLLLPVLAVAAAPSEQRRQTRIWAMVATLFAIVPFAWLLVSPVSVEHRLQVQERFVAVTAILPIIANQFSTLAATLWLQVTAPVLALALLGLWSLRRKRVVVVIGPWALCSGLPRVLAPTAYITPRHLVYVAVPILALAACGLVALADAAISRGWTRDMKPRVFVVAFLGLVIAPSVVIDATIITVPARTPLVAFDRWQYVTGWPSGYAVTRVASYLHRQEARRDVTVLIPPGYFVNAPLSVLLSGDPRINLTMVAPETLSAHLPRAVGGKSIFVLAYQPSHVALNLDRKRVRLVLHAATHDDDGACDLYRVIE